MDKKHTILVIEDNEINRDVVNEILNEEYNLYFAENGKVGMEVLRQHKDEVDVILLDIQMPVMNGYEVLKEIGKDKLLKEIPVIVTTSLEEDGEEILCLELGATEFMRKPYNPVIVKIRLKNIIHLRESTMANMQKTKFIQNMNHEIRTPMNSILGFSQLLGMPSGTLDDEERATYAECIVNNAHLLLGMIDDMLILSDFEHNEMKAEKDSVYINKICRNAMKTAEFRFPEGVNVYFTTDVDDTYIVNTDGRRIQQILVNFLTNACKSTTKGEIHLHCSDKEKQGFVSLSVADTGIGIPADKAEYIFERFVKLDSFKPGNGLGLNICRQIADCLGANVYLDTTYTQGARFVFELPL